MEIYAPTQGKGNIQVHIVTIVTVHISLLPFIADAIACRCRIW